MKSRLIKVLIFSLLAIFLVACGKVMITGRKQVLLYSQGEITSLSNQSYSDLMSKSTFSTNANYKKMVNGVGINLTSAVAEYLKQNGAENELEGITWKFDVVKDETVNAFCLPNGNIVFYEGIMKITNTPDLVAVVMGHEIAHALAKHGNERMSQEALVGVAGQALSAYTGTKSEKTQTIFEMAFGMGTQLGVLLPYSRKHEYEADRIGLIIMSMAGYDINVAPKFWETMSASGTKQPEFISTHPSDENRVKNIIAILPEAAKYARKK
ncbi:MAG: M48 family metallopeptidase [Bacteroidales bacterium]